jgi:TRAP-type transport system periplasmic protein
MQVGKTFKFADHMRFILMDHGVAYATTCWIAMNKKSWESLPNDIHAIIDKINDEFVPKFGGMHKRGDDEGQEYNFKVGVMLVKVSAAEESKTAAKMKPLFDDHIRRTTSKGLAGNEAVNFCKEYLKTH